MPALHYADDITCKDAFGLLREEKAATLLDVRTDAEWSYVGRPDLSIIGKAPVLVSWQIWPKMDVDPGFVASVEQAIPDKTAPVLVLCRSGVRSKAAATALTEAGYSDARNVLDGFEGPKDDHGHRNTMAGWRADDLPWEQG